MIFPKGSTVSSPTKPNAFRPGLVYQVGSQLILEAPAAHFTAPTNAFHVLAEPELPGAFKFDRVVPAWSPQCPRLSELDVKELRRVGILDIFIQHFKRPISMGDASAVEYIVEW